MIILQACEHASIGLHNHDMYSIYILLPISYINLGILL